MDQKTYDLDELVQTYDIENPYEQYKRLEFLEKLQRHVSLPQATVLELGPASGLLTLLLSQHVKRLVAVEGSSVFLEMARQRVGHLPHVQLVLSYFENFSTEETFDCIIMHHVLEHLKDPLPVLTRYVRFLCSDGVIALTVPNAHALSRQLAVQMGLLTSVYELSENDRNHGHYRVYDWKSMEQTVQEAGYEIIARHGLSLKLLSDRQMNQMLEAGIMGQAQIMGLWSIADQYRDIAGAIMILAKPKLK
ncbi:MAG: class I SAM-dependent methyltransferase [Chitinophagales bacterium]|nr:class I SAM-dependent methyltransferase [Chitinophagales bacterium]MDW8428113.1 class I SAM-dependent methyltransferase [Chitinophagales bacterium]